MWRVDNDGSSRIERITGWSGSSHSDTVKVEYEAEKWQSSGAAIIAYIHCRHIQ